VKIKLVSQHMKDNHPLHTTYDIQHTTHTHTQTTQVIKGRLKISSHSLRSPCKSRKRRTSHNPKLDCSSRSLALSFLFPQTMQLNLPYPPCQSQHTQVWQALKTAKCQRQQNPNPTPAAKPPRISNLKSRMFQMSKCRKHKPKTLNHKSTGPIFKSPKHTRPSNHNLFPPHMLPNLSSNFP
jgi:hypothetical protein